MSTLSTHVLDAASGQPAVGIEVELTDAAGAALGQGRTDDDGRIGAVAPEALGPGSYRLTFQTGRYHEATGQQGFFPEVTITFAVTDERHYHVPLLLSPYAYSTYRGS